ncbi:hypothetical protein [Kribbella sp. HUAS MG21]|uniref:Uncharacterized protein n=1 Tax=Kribbella sp. HUAS MG21 TaxID=3160966 RepID=A0AAU7TLW6_9ACTN
MTFPKLLRGAGWSSYAAIGLSVNPDRRTARNQFYGLSNGTVRRWVINSFGWSPTGQTGGFSAVKTWALLSQSTTYDTFLATTRGGALYTIRLPLTKSMTPVVKQVRSRMGKLPGTYTDPIYFLRTNGTYLRGE